MENINISNEDKKLGDEGTNENLDKTEIVDVNVENITIETEIDENKNEENIIEPSNNKEKKVEIENETMNNESTEKNPNEDHKTENVNDENTKGKVFSGSPAEGILQRNDEIKLIDNCNVENASLKEVQDLIRTSGSQLNFIVARDSNKPKNYDNEQDEEQVSVKTARMKFLNNENRSPQPFGQFGTQFHKKSNTLPTSLKIDNAYDFSNKTNVRLQTNEMDDDDIADYNFMTLPVSERKKLFASPTDNTMSKTMPRQRSQSFRPNQRYQQALPKAQTTVFQRKPHEFGWGPSQEKIDKARQVLPNQSTVPLRYQSNLDASPRINRQSDQIINNYFPGYQTTPRSTQSNRRYSSTATIPGQNRHIITSSLINGSSSGFENQYQGDTIRKETKYVYHCGRKNDARSVEPSIMIIPPSRQPQNLYVNTYGTVNQSLSSQSPRYFRPAYPAYSADNSGVDNMSIISVRSEPYSKHMDRSIGFDKPGSYRINRDSSSAQRDYPQQMNTLQIGEPRTRVVANPASPSCHLNWSFWGHDQQPNRSYEEPTEYYKVESSPRVTNATPFRRGPTVTKSHSTLVMNPNRVSNDSVYAQVSYMKQRDSLAGISDF